jgi:hypothetical protein
MIAGVRADHPASLREHGRELRVVTPSNSSRRESTSSPTPVTGDVFLNGMSFTQLCEFGALLARSGCESAVDEVCAELQLMSGRFLASMDLFKTGGFQRLNQEALEEVRCRVMRAGISEAPADSIARTLLMQAGQSLAREMSGICDDIRQSLLTGRASIDLGWLQQLPPLGRSYGAYIRDCRQYGAPPPTSLIYSISALGTALSAVKPHLGRLDHQTFNVLWGACQTFQFNGLSDSLEREMSELVEDYAANTRRIHHTGLASMTEAQLHDYAEVFVRYGDQEKALYILQELARRPEALLRLIAEILRDAKALCMDTAPDLPRLVGLLTCVAGSIKAYQTACREYGQVEAPSVSTALDELRLLLNGCTSDAAVRPLRRLNQEQLTHLATACQTLRFGDILRAAQQEARRFVGTIHTAQWLVQRVGLDGVSYERLVAARDEIDRVSQPEPALLEFRGSIAAEIERQERLLTADADLCVARQP